MVSFVLVVVGLAALAVLAFVVRGLVGAAMGIEGHHVTSDDALSGSLLSVILVFVVYAMFAGAFR